MKPPKDRLFKKRRVPKVYFQCDQEDKRVISEEQGQLLAVHHGIDFIECSAMSGENVREAFYRMARRVKTKHESKESAQRADGSKSVKILSDPGSPSPLGKSLGNCC